MFAYMIITLLYQGEQWTSQFSGIINKHILPIGNFVYKNVV